MRVLLIDDDEDVRRIAQLSLGRLGGMHVVEASDGAGGLLAAAAERPDLILLDVMMPGLDGPATLERLRERSETAAIPVVFLTGRADEDGERLLEMGVLGVVAKPFDPLALPGIVRDLVTGDRK